MTLDALILSITSVTLLPMLPQFIVPPVPVDHNTTVRVILGLGRSRLVQEHWRQHPGDGALVSIRSVDRDDVG